MNNQTVTITPEYNGERIDRALAALTGQTRSAVARALKKGRVTKEGATKPHIKNATTVSTGERYQVIPPSPDEPVGDSIPFNFATQIIYEDAAILVINKTAGQVVHPSAGHNVNTIAQAVVSHYPSIKDACYDDTDLARQRPGIVHRLDKATSGVLVIAKTRPVLLALQQQFKSRTIVKEYAAIVYGTVTAPIVVDAPVARHPIHRQHQAVVETGKSAQTHLIPQRSGIVNGIPLTYVIAKPVTGRTHQIRVHCRHIKHPIIGDARYHTKLSAAAAATLPVHNLMLHAWQLSLHHPLTNEPVSYTAPLPSYFCSLLDAF